MAARWCRNAKESLLRRCGMRGRQWVSVCETACGDSFAVDRTQRQDRIQFFDTHARRRQQLASIILPRPQRGIDTLGLSGPSG